MLERIGALMSSVRQVSDNIAHDLRTPLTRLRTKLELANAEAGAPEPLRTAVEGAIADAEELLATFNALLRIARIESGRGTAGFTEVDLARLVEDVADLYEPLAAERQQRFEVAADTTAPVRGDRDLLFQAAANLVDNAIKYTPESGRIQVSVTQAAGEVGLQVADSGPGVPAEMREKVLERFFRLDDSRTTPGNGLGLSLVKAVVELHGGSLRLGDNQPGLRVGIWLPALGSPSVQS
jgi:signal transduction histidine kinase